MWFMFVIPFIMFVVIFLSVAMTMFKGHKNVDTMQTMIEDVARKRLETEIVPTSKEPERHCEYCGAKIVANQSRCNACGARVKNK